MDRSGLFGSLPVTEIKRVLDRAPHIHRRNRLASKTNALEIKRAKNRSIRRETSNSRSRLVRPESGSKTNQSSSEHRPFRTCSSARHAGPRRPVIVRSRHTAAETMGMITRVRGRVRSDSLSKSDPRLNDEKIAKTVCLLSVVLLLPYCGRGPAPGGWLLGGWLAAYSCLVLPLLISANYKYPVKVYSRILDQVRVLARRTYRPVLRTLSWLYSPMDRCETIFMRMSNLSAMANQLTFFVMCDRVLGGHRGPQQRPVTCLYSLMFYNVIAYCVSYIRELIEKENWSPYVNMTHHSELKHLAMTTTKIVLEWTKAVTFVVTVTFTLLVFGLERGLEQYQPTALYQVATWCYYVATEKVFVEMFPGLLALFRFDAFESLETLYAPVLLRAFTMGLSFVLVVPLLFCARCELPLLVLVLYLNIFLKAKDAWKHSWRELRAECAVLERFRRACRDEIRSLEDVCAVCLSVMKSARVTPCHHFFHGDCLRQCLKASDKCPICVRQFKFD